MSESSQPGAVGNRNAPPSGANAKSVGLAYVLWFLLGLAGVHRIYLGRVGSGVGMLILTLLTICFGYIIFIGWFLALPLGLAVFVWWIVDAFLIPGIAPRSQS